MAIDTRDKRCSAIATRSFNIVLPVSDGDISTTDRKHVLGLYSGILSGLVLEWISINNIDTQEATGTVVNTQEATGTVVNTQEATLITVGVSSW